ncbi:MAG: glycosyltransferase family 2 protein [Planctomycetes bacterium]|nr:glycosyltransferase family 2 protein [Planctomycetota bacterium]
MVATSPVADYLASIVIEWENIQLAEADRCAAMLGELARQIEAFPAAATVAGRDFEIIVIFDDRKIAESDVRGFVASCMPRPPARAEMRFVGGRGRSYYEQKNLGAESARGRYVVFLDSDVIPEPGWLERLLDSFADPRVEVVCGNCFLDTGDLVSKSVALAWFFPLRDGREVLARQESFFANNVAFRREVAAGYPFEPLAGSSRGACRLLARRLVDDGRGLFVNTAARVSHPAPNGLRHLVLRGLAQGRDNLLFNRTIGGGGAWESVLRSMRMQLRAWKRIVRHRRTVGLGILAVPAALMVATSYYACYAIGDAATRIAPGWADRHLRV